MKGQVMTFIRFSPPDYMNQALEIYKELGPIVEECRDGCFSLGHCAFIFDESDESLRVAEKVRAYLFRKTLRFLSLQVREGDLTTPDPGLLQWIEERHLPIGRNQYRPDQ